MAARSHSVHLLRGIPTLAARFARLAMELVVTAGAIILLDPRSAPAALLVAFLALAVPILLQRPLKERDLRVRTHCGSLSRFYLDALLAMVPIRTQEPVPKENLIETMQKIASITAQAPIAVGDVISEDITGTGIPLLACRNIAGK